MEFYEVVIVGAGPAGLACAERLGKAGKKVLLLEKNKVIGPKVCAGGLTGKDLKNFNLPDNLLDHKFKEATIYSPLQKFFVSESNFFIYTIDRKNLGQWQLAKIEKNNVSVRVNSMVTEITDSFVMINNNEKVGFKYLVGADGSNSIVRKFLGLKICDMITAMQYIVPDEKYKKFEMFFDPNLFSLGYVWIFPHKGYTSIGCGCDPRLMSAKKLRQGFDEWLKEKRIDVSRGEFQAHPINIDFQGYKFGNIFLAGDAAGLASCLIGEGIYQALVSGQEIADMIIDEKHIPLQLNEIIDKSRAHYRVFKFLEYSKYLLPIEFEIAAVLLRNRIIQKKLIDFLI